MRPVAGSVYSSVTPTPLRELGAFSSGTRWLGVAGRGGLEGVAHLITMPTHEVRVWAFYTGNAVQNGKQEWT